jgi:hypothetical protein
VNLVAATPPCPVHLTMARSVRLDVTARTARPWLTWRRAASTSDVVEPRSATIPGNGTTTVYLSTVVLDAALTLELVDEDRVLVTVTLRNH